jgi:hypothetical protein
MSDEDTYEIPLQDQRVFGAGIKRKRVKFVPSTESSSTLTTPPTRLPAKSVSDLYLKLVLPKDESSEADELEPADHLSASLKSTGKEPAKSPKKPQVCEICNLPLSPDPVSAGHAIPTTTSQDSVKTRPHEASLAHQVCLPHSHLPSNLDRKRKGLTYLSAYGWDPDSRLGLGAKGQGIQFPIKAKQKDDKLGLGVVLPKEEDWRKKEKKERLDAGKVRKLQEKDKSKGERLREIFYRNDDVERYLGGG